MFSKKFGIFCECFCFSSCILYVIHRCKLSTYYFTQLITHICSLIAMMIFEVSVLFVMVMVTTMVNFFVMVLRRMNWIMDNFLYTNRNFFHNWEFDFLVNWVWFIDRHFDLFKFGKTKTYIFHLKFVTFFAKLLSKLIENKSIYLIWYRFFDCVWYFFDDLFSFDGKNRQN